MDEAELAKILNQASREQVLEYLHDLTKNHSPNLISNQHPCYLKMSILGTTFIDKDVGSYISSLPLVHCLDAWKYISRAFQALNRGDSATACHLAYYAELRAAISILASEGIGIFRNHYAIIKSDRTYKTFELVGEDGKPKETHHMTWILLRRLCYDTRFTDVLSRMISIENYELNDILQNFGYSNASLKDFWSISLSEWGIDLKLMNNEQNRRNIASYLPNWFIRSQHCKFKEIIRFSSNIWRLLEYANKSFINLDRALFKKTLEALRGSRNWTQQEYYNELDKVLKLQGTPETSSLYKYLHEDNPQDILDHAKNKTEGIFPNCEISMMSRAVLLSRVSLGAVKLLLEDSDSLPAGVNGILLEYGIKHGIIDSTYDTSVDLFADIDDTLIKADKWCADTTTETPNNWNVFSKESANILTSFERIPILGLSR